MMNSNHSGQMADASRFFPSQPLNPPDHSPLRQYPNVYENQPRYEIENYKSFEPSGTQYASTNMVQPQVNPYALQYQQQQQLQYDHNILPLSPRRSRTISENTKSTRTRPRKGTGRKTKWQGGFEAQEYLLDDRVTIEPSTSKNQEKEKYFGFSSGLPLLRTLLVLADLPLSTPWSHLGCLPFLAEMKKTAPVAGLPVPSRKTATILLDIYADVVSITYPLFTRQQLRFMLNEVYLNGQIARRQLNESTSNCFVLILAQVYGILSRYEPELNHLQAQNLSFTRTGLAEVFLHPSLGSVKCLLSILVANHSTELADPIWYTSGMALLMCVDLNIHTESAIDLKESASTEEELEEARRIFWSAYSIDRGLALVFGRPLTLLDETITCPYPSRVPAQALARFQIRRLQSRIMSNSTISSKSSKLQESFPTSDELLCMKDLATWATGRTGEELIQAGNSELLLLRRLVVLHDPSAMARCAVVVQRNLEIYLTEALQIAMVEGLLLGHDLFMNFVTLMYIYEFGQDIQGITLEMIESWVHKVRPIYEQLTIRWSTARESLKLIEQLLQRLKTKPD